MRRGLLLGGLVLIGVGVPLLGAASSSLAAGHCPAGRIAFLRESGRRGGIYSVCPDGSGLVRLTSGLGDFRPAWSPNGDKIAFQRHGDIYVMRADGSHVARLTHQGGFTPAWSPSGRQVA